MTAVISGGKVNVSQDNLKNREVFFASGRCFDLFILGSQVSIDYTESCLPFSQHDLTIIILWCDPKDQTKDSRLYLFANWGKSKCFLSVWKANSLVRFFQMKHLLASTFLIVGINSCRSVCFGTAGNFPDMHLTSSHFKRSKDIFGIFLGTPFIPTCPFLVRFPGLLCELGNMTTLFKTAVVNRIHRLKIF